MFVKLIALDFLLVAVAGLVNEHQLRVIEYVLVENRILREMLGERRLRFTDEQRRRLAVKAKLLGRWQSDRPFARNGVRIHFRGAFLRD